MQQFKQWLKNQIHSVEPDPEFLKRSRRTIEAFVREEVQKRTDWNQSYWHYWKITLAGLGGGLAMIFLIRVVPVEAAPYNWWYPVDQAWDSLKLKFTRDKIDYALLVSSLLQERVKEWKEVAAKESIPEEDKKIYFEELEKSIVPYLESIVSFIQDGNQPQEIKDRLVNESKVVLEEWQKDETPVPTSAKNFFDIIFTPVKEEDDEFLYNAPFQTDKPIAHQSIKSENQLPQATLLPSAIKPAASQFQERAESVSNVTPAPVLVSATPRASASPLPTPMNIPNLDPVSEQEHLGGAVSPTNVSCSEDAQSSPIVLTGRGSVCATVTSNPAKAIIRISRGQVTVSGKGTATIKQGSLFSLKGYDGIDTKDVQLPITVLGEGSASVSGDNIDIEVSLESGELSASGNGTIELGEGWKVGYQRLESE